MTHIVPFSPVVTQLDGAKGSFGQEIVDPFEAEFRVLSQFQNNTEGLINEFDLVQMPEGLQIVCSRCGMMEVYSSGIEVRFRDCQHCGDYLTTFLASGSKLDNPLVDIFNRVMTVPRATTISMLAMRVRDYVVKKYSWAVPTDVVLETIASLGPVVEMGAGTGYWGWLLDQLGVDFVGYDRYPRTETFRVVNEGGPSRLTQHANRTLLLVWPPYGEAMAAECLRYWEGTHLVYIGEWGDCTGDEVFHHALDKWFDIVAMLPVPCWPGLHDACYVLKRKRSAPRRRTRKKRVTQWQDHFRNHWQSLRHS